MKTSLLGAAVGSGIVSSYHGTLLSARQRSKSSAKPTRAAQRPKWGDTNAQKPPSAVARELRTLAESESLHLDVLELDVTHNASVERAVDLVIAQRDRIDVLVNNAGYLLLGLHA